MKSFTLLGGIGKLVNKQTSCELWRRTRAVFRHHLFGYFSSSIRLFGQSWTVFINRQWLWPPILVEKTSTTSSTSVISCTPFISTTAMQRMRFYALMLFLVYVSELDVISVWTKFVCNLYLPDLFGALYNFYRKFRRELVW